jgi:AcrR family transcriptional regulator
VTACAKAPIGLEPYRYFADFIDGRRGEILDAALAVFGEKGYEGGTMREIAARVGVSEPAIYRHYESKEAILADIVATAGDRITGEMHQGFGAVNGGNVVPMLHAFLDMRRRGFDAKRAAHQAAGGAGWSPAPNAPEALRSGAGGVMHILFHAAPHNETFIGLMRAHLGRPMVDVVRALIPRVDADFGIVRTPEEVEARLLVFMSLFAGYFTASLLFEPPPDDNAVVEAMLAIMGWEPTEQTS